MLQIFFFTEILLHQEMTAFHFFLVQRKKTSIKIITKYWEVFSQFKENKNVIDISSVKNWFKFLKTMFKPFDFIKWQENICHRRSTRRSHGHIIYLFIENIIKYQTRFLSSGRQKVRFLNSELFIPSIISSLL